MNLQKTSDGSEGRGLPAPFGPNRATIPPSGTDNDTPWRTRTTEWYTTSKLATLSTMYELLRGWGRVISDHRPSFLCEIWLENARFCARLIRSSGQIHGLNQTTRIKALNALQRL